MTNEQHEEIMGALSTIQVQLETVKHRLDALEARGETGFNPVPLHQVHLPKVPGVTENLKWHDASGRPVPSPLDDSPPDTTGLSKAEVL